EIEFRRAARAVALGRGAAARPAARQFRRTGRGGLVLAAAEPGPRRAARGIVRPALLAATARCVPEKRPRASQPERLDRFLGRIPAGVDCRRRGTDPG